jgi:arsenite methyltransferase
MNWRMANPLYFVKQRNINTPPPPSCQPSRFLPVARRPTPPKREPLRLFRGSLVFINGRIASRSRSDTKTNEMKRTMKTQELENDIVKQNVRGRYGQIAEQGGSCGCAPVCCSPKEAGDRDEHDPSAVSRGLGYSAEEVRAVPDGANLGLGCGNPQAIAALRSGETVLDLGSGAGFDAFLAAGAVGLTGRVIGVDMTPEMISKARANQARGGYEQVEFRLGEIESLPVADSSVDVILSNCVINLSPDKPRVFREAFRVLKPGGRLAVSDIVALAPIPEVLRRDWELYTGCVAGASTVEELKEILKATGFDNIRIARKGESGEIIGQWFPGRKVEEFVASASIEAVKPPTN